MRCMNRENFDLSLSIPRRMPGQGGVGPSVHKCATAYASKSGKCGDEGKGSKELYVASRAAFKLRPGNLLLILPLV